jgi:hypothetical protein
VLICLLRGAGKSYDREIGIWVFDIWIFWKIALDAIALI